jgi:hypothetical protein
LTQPRPPPAHALHHRVDLIALCDVGLRRHGVAPALADAGGGLLRALFEAVVHAHPRALFGEDAGDRFANAATRPADDRNLPGQHEVHSDPSSPTAPSCRRQRTL